MLELHIQSAVREIYNFVRGSDNVECIGAEEQIKSCLYFTISRLFRVVNKVAEEAFSEMDICPTHAFLMILLQEEKEGLSVNQISEMLTIAPSTVTRFVDKLIVKGYVERIKVGKQSFTKITREGLKIMPEVFASWDKLFSGMENLVNDENYLKKTAPIIMEFTNLVEENYKKI